MVEEKFGSMKCLYAWGISFFLETGGPGGDKRAKPLNAIGIEKKPRNLEISLNFIGALVKKVKCFILKKYLEKNVIVK